MSSSLALSVRGLGVRRGRRAIVEDLSLRHTPGRAAWLVGENGSGKSSLMRVLAGLDPPAAGSVSREGVEGCRHPTAYYHPEMGLPGSVRVSDWRRLLASLGPRQDEGRGLGPPLASATTSLAGLSTGEEKRLILDAVLGSGRPFVFLDEPYEHLSAEGKELLSARIAAAARRRVVVVATNQQVPPALAGGIVMWMDAPAE